MYNLQLQRLRKAAGYKSQPEFAKLLGIKPRKYESWEREEVRLSLEDACRIADVLGCSLDELAGREEFMNKYADERQQDLNGYFSKLDNDERDYAVASLHGMVAHSNSRDAEAADKVDKVINA